MIMHNPKKTSLAGKKASKVRFFFDRKPYFAHSGDTLEDALIYNGILSFFETTHHKRKMGIHHNNAFAGYVKITHNGESFLTSPKALRISQGLQVFSHQSNSFFSRIRKFSLKHFFSSGLLPRQDNKAKTIHHYVSSSLGINNDNDVPTQYEKSFLHTDVHVIGAGIYGLYTALICVMSGLKVLITEKKDQLHISNIYQKELSDEARNIYQTVINHPNITIIYNTHIQPLEENDSVIGLKYPNAIDLSQPNQFNAEIFQIQTCLTFIATGKEYASLNFPGCDLGGILSPSQFLDYTKCGYLNQKNICIYTNNDEIYYHLDHLTIHEKEHYTILDIRPALSDHAHSLQKKGFRIYSDTKINQFYYKKNIGYVNFYTEPKKLKNIRCDCIIQSVGHHLDISLYRKNPHILKLNNNIPGQAYLCPPKSFFDNHFIVVGHGTGEDNIASLLKETYHRVKKCLEENDYTVALPVFNSAEHTSEKVNFFGLSNHNIDHKVSQPDKIFFLPDIRLSDLKDSLLKEISLKDFILNYCSINDLSSQTFHLFELIRYFSQQDNKNFIKKFAKYTQYIFNESLYKTISQALTHLPIFSSQYSPLYPSFKQHMIPLHEKNNMILSKPISESKGHIGYDALYSVFKNDFLICDYDTHIGPYHFVGKDACSLLEKTFNIDLKTLPLSKGIKTFYCSYDYSIQGFVHIYHYSENKYLVFSFDLNKNFLQSLSNENMNNHVAISNMEDQQVVLHVTGYNALKKLKFFIPSFSYETLEGFPFEKNSYIIETWYGNIAIFLTIVKEFNSFSLYCIIPSDAVSSIFCHLFENKTPNINHICNKNFIKMLEIETGACQSLEKKYLPIYKKPFLAIPLSKKDMIQKGDLIYNKSDSLEAIGVVLESTYSAYHKKHLAYIHLKNTQESYKDKVLCLENKKDDCYFDIKILSLNYIKDKVINHE